MTTRIAFLHTSPAHVATFNALVQRLAPEAQVTHVVDESLLADARRLGTDDAALVARVHGAMREAAQSGADMVVCTCSTIGSVAEQMPTQGAFLAARIDRAMADAAVRAGQTILVAAVLESTAAPTAELIHDSAAKVGKTVAVDTLLIPEAWPLFERGDLPAYHAAIAAAVRLAARNKDAVVLAQASMAGAADLLGDLGIPVYSSPVLGVQAAIRAV